MLIPSIDLMGGRIVQLVRGEKLKLAFDDFEYWIRRFETYPLVQLIDPLTSQPVAPASRPISLVF